MDVSPLTCSSEELFAVISSSNTQRLRLCLSNPAITPQHVVMLLRNHHITQDMIETICDREDWLKSHTVVFAVVNCPRSPYTVAMRLMQLLYWNDLMKTAGNLRISPRLRRTAENHLRDKMVELTLGEKMTAARTGPRAVVSILRDDPEPRVIAALLRNPHVIEEDVIRIVNDDLVDADTLAAVGQDYKWAQSYPVRLALVRNQRTPLPLALSLVSKLRRQDLEPLIRDPHTAELVRRAATRILEGDY
jgi:hypothetical protein